jgi:hypothetical protein
MLSAKAAVMAETPKLVLLRVAFQNQNSALDARLQWPTIVNTFHNYGRTPAFLHKASMDVFIGPSLPAEPVYRNTLSLSPDDVVPAANPYVGDAARAEGHLSQEDIGAIANGHKFLWTYGYIAYFDFLGEPHVARFCRRFIPPAKAGMMENWIGADAPKAYTESS